MPVVRSLFTAFFSRYQGEILLPKSNEKSFIPGGIRKSNAVLMDTEPDKLTVQSSRQVCSSRAVVRRRNSSRFL